MHKTSRQRVGIVRNNELLDHKLSIPVKECPERLSRIYAALRQDDNRPRLATYAGEPLDEEAVAAVHSSLYMKQVREHAVRDDPFSYDKDTYLTETTPYTARLAAGACVRLADAIMYGEVTRGFALVRPPGHHAETGRGMGFCVYNNVALTAAHLLEHHGLKRILIVDFDVHHGNGTQDIFYQSDQVLTFSIHQKDLFPFTGAGAELGAGDGLGYNINLPIPSHFGDEEYSGLFGAALHGVVANYLPQVLLVSAGFDAHHDDPISKTQVSTEGFAFMARALRYFAEQYCDGRLLFVLEGGYNVNALAESVMATLDVLTAPQVNPPGFIHSLRVLKVIENEVPRELRQAWDFDL